MTLNQPKGIGIRRTMRPLHFGVPTLALLLLLGLPSQAQAQLSFAPAVNFTTGLTPNSIAIGDLDGDGNLDLAVTNNTSAPSTVSVLLGNGAGSFGPKTDFQISAIGVLPNFVAIADLDGDGDLDIAVTNRTVNTVSVFLNTTVPPGPLSFAAPTTFGTGFAPNSVAIGDLDGDGNLDLAVTNNTSTPSTVSVLLGNGAGSFGPKTDFQISAIGVLPNFVAIADLDGDGDLDLAVTTAADNMVSVFLNTTVPPGPLSFAAPTPFVTGLTPNSIAIGDLDGDGNLDLAVTNNTSSPSTISVLLGNGAGSFGPKTDFTIIAGGFFPNFVAIGDLDRDLDLDLAVTNAATTTVSVFLNTTVPPGPLSFAAPTTFAVGNTPNFVAIADLDGDGDLDIAVTNGTDTNVSVLLNTTPPPPPPPPPPGGGGGSTSNCFIATAAFGSPLASQVQLLRKVRDQDLLPHPAGQAFVAL